MTAKAGFSGLINLVVLLKVVVCGAMLELVHRNMCVLGGVKHLSCSLCLIEFAYLSCRISLKNIKGTTRQVIDHSMRRKPCLDAGLSAIC